jgi:hypothetical protein
MNCGKRNQINLGPGIGGKIEECYLVGMGGCAIIDAEVDRHPDLLRKVQESLTDKIWHCTVETEKLPTVRARVLFNNVASALC